jgi:hypothetical protein
MRHMPVGEQPSWPDGLNESAVDALIAEVDAVLAASPGPTSALVDGTAAERRRRRLSRRAVAAVVRAMPVTRPVSGADEGEAA